MALRVSALHRRRIVFCTLGELIGFAGIPVLGGALAFWLSAGLAPESRAVTLYVAAVVGGFGEGAVLAWFQLMVLRAHLPRLRPRRWVAATALAVWVATFVVAGVLMGLTVGVVTGYTLVGLAPLESPRAG